MRYIDTETGPNGDVISNYDLRLVQPNENAIPTAGLHTIEHTIAVLLRERIPRLHRLLSVRLPHRLPPADLGHALTEDVARALKESLEFIAYKATWDDIPATTIESCGNYRDHSLFTAKGGARTSSPRASAPTRSSAKSSEAGTGRHSRIPGIGPGYGMRAASVSDRCRPHHNDSR